MPTFEIMIFWKDGDITNSFYQKDEKNPSILFVLNRMTLILGTQAENVKMIQVIERLIQ